MWEHLVNGMIDCLIMTQVTIICAELTWIIWH